MWCMLRDFLFHSISGVTYYTDLVTHLWIPTAAGQKRPWSGPESPGSLVGLAVFWQAGEITPSTKVAKFPLQVTELQQQPYVISESPSATVNTGDGEEAGFPDHP